MAGASLDLDAVAPEAVPGIRILPVLHDRLDLGGLARWVLAELDPAAVAVELPTTLAAAAERAVARLPRISVILSEEEDEEAAIWITAPGDPFVEALRWARERDRPRFYVDPDLADPGRHHDPVPDPHSLWELGPAAYLELLRRQMPEAGRGRADELREGGMAYHLQAARARLGEGPLLVLVGAAHAAGVAARLRGPTAQPLARTRRAHVEVRHLDPESLTGLLPDPPLAHAVFETLRAGGPEEEPPLEAALSRKVSLIRHGFRVIQGEGGDDLAERRRRLVAYASRRGARRPSPDLAVPDRAALTGVVWRVAAGSYERQTSETVAPWQRRLYFDFGRRHARVQGLLVPGLYEWVVAARGVGDDNLAWEVFDAARTYPWQEADSELPPVRLDGDELDLGTRKVRFRRRFFRVKQRPVLVPVRERPQPEDPEEWLRGFDSAGLCSYPPEDLVIEDYGRYLQKRAVSVLTAERRRVEPFSASLLDGIDVRETLRNLQDDRVWVQELGRAPGEAGSVVVVFDRDLGGDRFPFLMTWHGEHTQESDMAFYATHPAEQVVGPGIMRATYGGFMLTMPPGRLFEVWQDPDYHIAREKAEVLVMAAIDYSLEKLVVHVAKDPPSERMRRYASVQGKRLVHLPIGSLSPTTLKKIRVVHILAGRDKRAIAKDYAW